jgi:hypothetical protein
MESSSTTSTSTAGVLLRGGRATVYCMHSMHGTADGAPELDDVEHVGCAAIFERVLLQQRDTKGHAGEDLKDH